MMVFEMTRDYGLILPLMLTSVIAYGIARRLYSESIYSEWLVRRGVVLTSGADAAVLARIPVHECMNRQPVVIPEATPLAAIVSIIAGSRQTDHVVVDDTGALVGMLSQQAVRQALEQARLGDLILASDLAEPDAHPLTSDDTLLTALRRFGAHDTNVLPVVSPPDRHRLEGLVSQQDLIAAYERGLTAEGGH